MMAAVRSDRMAGPIAFVTPDSGRDRPTHCLPIKENRPEKSSFISILFFRPPHCCCKVHKD
jgi:hypothetical protein